MRNMFHGVLVSAEGKRGTRAEPFPQSVILLEVAKLSESAAAYSRTTPSLTVTT